MPLAAYSVIHLWQNAAALRGRHAYSQMQQGLHELPYLVVAEVALVLAPLAFHAAIGLKLVLDARYNVATYGYTRNWMFTLQRITGVVAFGFILYHLYELRFPMLTGAMGPQQFYDVLSSNLSSTYWGIPALALLYILGIAAVSFHLANGIWGFLFSWGITITRRAQRMAAAITGVVGMMVFFLGANTVIYFATGSRLYVPPQWGSQPVPELSDCEELSTSTAPPASAAQPAASVQP